MATTPDATEVAAENDRPGGRSRLRVLVGVGVEIGVVALVVWVLWAQRDELARLWDLSHWDVLGLFALMGVESFLRTFEFRYCLRHLDAEVSFGEAYSLVHGATLLNYGPLSAGTVLRAVALRRARGLSFTQYAAMMGMIALMTLAAGAVLGLIGLLFSPDLAFSRRVMLAGGFALALLLVVAIVYLPPAWIAGEGFLRSKARSLFDAVRLLRHRRRQVVLLFTSATLKLLMIAARFWICFGALSMLVSPLGALIFAALTSLMLLLAVTPGSVGIREVFIGAFAGLIGFGFAEATLAASVDRVAMFAFAVATGVPSLLYLKARGLAR